MTRPDSPPVQLPVVQRRYVRYAGLVAAAAALSGSLAACGKSANGPSLSSATVTSTPSASAPTSESAAVAAQAKALLARLHSAETKLAGDYSWVTSSTGGKSTGAKSGVAVFDAQRSALSGAQNALTNAAHAARSAAQATPRNCPVVASQRQAAYAAYNKGMAAFNSFVPAATAALAALGHTAGDRAVVQSAYNEVKAFAAAHPEADINMSVETSLAAAHSAGDDKALTDAIHAAQTSVFSGYADLQKTRGNVANIAPSCG